MNKKIFYGAISLDGYLAGPNDDLSWLLESDTGNKSTYDDFIKDVGVLIMGHQTYNETKKLLDGEPFYPSKEVYVFSRDEDLVLPDAKVVHGKPTEFLDKLDSMDENIWLVGGGELLIDFLNLDLIDEWFIQIAPVILGEGKRLFQNNRPLERLKLKGSKTFGEFVELHYVKK